MSYLSVILIAVIEAMDCFAVATSIGLGRSGVSRLKATVLALSFGFFQGGDDPYRVLFWNFGKTLDS